MIKDALPNLTQAELMSAASNNLATHFTWVQRHTTNMTVIETDGLVLTDSGLPCDTFNAVCLAQLQAGTASDHIQRAITHFKDANRPFSWWLSPGDQPDNLGELLVKAGLEAAETELAMAANLNRLKVTELSPDGLQIQRVRTPEQLQDFARITAANWTPPDMEVVRFYDLAAYVLLNVDSPLRLYVGYLDEIPVATAEATLGGGVVGLYSICTLVDYRRRGFGTAMTLYPLLDARVDGYQTAILQASDEGALVYNRIGFTSFGQITEYKPPV